MILWIITLSTEASAMSRSATSLHPFVALKAIRAVLRDPEDTRQVFILMDALRGKTSLRQLARFRATDVGRAVLTERRRLFDWLSDRTRLAALPAGTLGRAYYEFISAEHLSAEGLAVVSNLRETLKPGEDMTLFRERTRDMHDLLHVLTGYGRDPLGEACLQAFTFAQSGLKGSAVIAVAGARKIARACPAQPVWRAIFEGYRRGRRAGWLVGADWEHLLNQPLEAVRARFGVTPPNYYPRIIASTRAALDAASPPARAMAT
jgi:ubiquinone biosynthesis protein COQ4